MRLIPIQRGGTLEESLGPLPTEARSVLQATSQLYDRAGFQVPWICYLAVTNGRVVGTCGFKAAPHDGRVEIAYFTFPGYEGKGVATQMARRLLGIARDEQPGLVVAARTLPGRNASHRVLEKLGFACKGSLQHPEDGTVLEWQTADRATLNP
jgi:[ribosomal protein S5]-alanine N-acetyltransferase